MVSKSVELKANVSLWVTMDFARKVLTVTRLSIVIWESVPALNRLVTHAIIRMNAAG